MQRGSRYSGPSDGAVLLLTVGRIPRNKAVPDSKVYAVRVVLIFDSSPEASRMTGPDRNNITNPYDVYRRPPWKLLENGIGN